MRVLSNLDSSIFPLERDVSEMHHFCLSNNASSEIILMNNPYELVEQFLKNPKMDGFLHWYNRILKSNDVYKSWISNFKSPSHLDHINMYLQTYSSDKYYDNYGSFNLINELYDNSHYLPKDQVLYRGGSHFELPTDFNVGDSFDWTLPRSTTLNIGSAHSHAFSDCSEKKYGQLLPHLTPTLLVLNIKDEYVRGHVFNYGPKNSKSIEKEVLLCPNIKLFKTGEMVFNNIKVVYLDIFGQN